MRLATRSGSSAIPRPAAAATTMPCWTDCVRSSSLGLMRFPMRRQLAPSDLAAAWRIAGKVRPLAPDILHGHGAKGGAYARTIGTLLRATGHRVARIYTPHGGSLHYDPKSAAGRVYFLAERALGRMTDGFIFVSQFEADTYAAKVGRPRAPASVIPNGLRPEEFEPVAAGHRCRRFPLHRHPARTEGPRRVPHRAGAAARGHRPRTDRGHRRRRRGEGALRRHGQRARPLRRGHLPRSHAGTRRLRAWPAPSSSRRAPSRCPMSCSRRSPPACR